MIKAGVAYIALALFFAAFGWTSLGPFQILVVGLVVTAVGFFKWWLYESRD
ncbi:MAG: hypothetical protein AB7F96_15440 [Beijerinckiaceae bacterium]